MAAPIESAASVRPDLASWARGKKTATRASDAQGQQDTLYALANDTGGKLFVDSNDLAVGIVQAQKDISSYYILGYYTSNSAQDGKFRRVKISLNPALSANLDYRQGYYASKVFGKFTVADKERQLEEAQRGLLPFTPPEILDADLAPPKPAQEIDGDDDALQSGELL